MLGVERCLATRLTAAVKEHFVCTPHSHHIPARVVETALRRHTVDLITSDLPNETI